MRGSDKILDNLRWLMLVCGLLLALPAAASADIYGFDGVSSNQPGNVVIGENQLRMEVTEYSATPQDDVQFRFYHEGYTSMSIARIYFDDNSGLLGSGTLLPGSGVNFTSGADPGELPGGGFVSEFKFQATPPPPKAGINPGASVGQPSEELSIVFDLTSGTSFSGILSALSSRSIRAGLHVISIDGPDAESSESFVNTPNPVPAPGAVLLAAIGLGMAGRRLRAG